LKDATLSLYVNVYDTGRGAVVYDSPVEARENARPGLIACVTLKEVKRWTPVGGLPTKTDFADSAGVHLEVARGTSLPLLGVSRPA
jgi:hypothetical protein